MKRLFIAAAALALLCPPARADDDSYDTFNPVVLRIPGGAPGCSAPATGFVDQSVVTTRSGTSVLDNGASTISCASNQPRLGPYGLVIEDGATNLVKNEDFTDATAWATAHITAALPSITATGVTAPDGTATAYTASFPAVAAGQASFFGTAAAMTVSGSGSVWVQSATGATSMIYVMTNCGGYHTAECVAGPRWQRCAPTACPSGGTVYFQVGMDLRDAQQSPTAAQTVNLWWPQYEHAPYSGGEVTGQSSRPAESATVNATHGVLSGTSVTGSMTVFPFWGSSNVGGVTRYALTTSDPSVFSLGFTTSSTWVLDVGGQTATSTVQTFNMRTSHTLSWRYSLGGTACLTVDSEAEVCSAGNVATTYKSRRLIDIGGGSSSGPFGGALSDVKFNTTFANRAYPIVCVGDSITSEVNVTTPWPAVLNTDLGTAFPVTNSGVSGNTTSQMLTRWDATERLFNYDWLTLLGGVNDANTGVPTATAWANLKQMYDEAMADGRKVVAITILPEKNNTYGYWNATVQAEIDSLNSSIRSYVAANPSSMVLVDGYALFGSPGDPAVLNPAYDSGDGLHPNQTGANYIAQLVAAAITAHTPGSGSDTAVTIAPSAVTGSFGEVITESRAGTANVTTMGSGVWTCPANKHCPGPGGIHNAPAETQYLLNNSPPATQTVTLPMGTFSGFVYGTGSIAYAVGTATAAGLPCTATSASPCAFTVSVGGTVVATVAGTLIWGDLADTAIPTDHLACAGTACTRAAGVYSAANYLTTGDSSWCVQATATQSATNWTTLGASEYLLALGATAGANTAHVYVDSTAHPIFSVYDNAGAIKTVTGSALGAGSHKVQACDNGGTLSLYVDGSATGSVTGAGTGVITTMPNTVYVGSLNGTTPIFGSVTGVALSRSSDPVRF